MPTTARPSLEIGVGTFLIKCTTSPADAALAATIACPIRSDNWRAPSDRSGFLAEARRWSAAFSLRRITDARSDTIESISKPTVGGKIRILDVNLGTQLQTLDLKMCWRAHIVHRTRTLLHADRPIGVEMPAARVVQVDDRQMVGWGASAASRNIHPEMC